MRGVRKKGGVIGDVCREAEVLEMVVDVKGSAVGGKGAGEVGVEGEVAEVSGDGVVASGGEECVFVEKGIFVILVSCGWVVLLVVVVVDGGVESYDT